MQSVYWFFKFFLKIAGNTARRRGNKKYKFGNDCCTAANHCGFSLGRAHTIHQIISLVIEIEKSYFILEGKALRFLWFSSPINRRRPTVSSSHCKQRFYSLMLVIIRSQPEAPVSSCRPSPSSVEENSQTTHRSALKKATLSNQCCQLLIATGASGWLLMIAGIKLYKRCLLCELFTVGNTVCLLVKIVHCRLVQFVDVRVLNHAPFFVCVP